MKQPCGCCAGIEIVTPENEANRPGLGALVYRAGTYATFFETMLARMSTLYLDVPVSEGSSTLERLFPLAGLVQQAGSDPAKLATALTTRALTDPSIALCDAWATLADVLTFYQERIANEGFLRTAIERRSVLELARLVGYELRPGISASVYLAFTVMAGFNGIVPQGTRAQSVPGVGEKPQFFETYDDLPARDVWNDIGARLTRPQIITLASSPKTGDPVTIDQGTDATTRDTLYFAGIATNLKAGDALLLTAGDGPGEQALRFVESVNVQNDQKRTEVKLQVTAPGISGTGNPGQRAVQTLHATLQPYIADAATMFSGGDLAEQVAQILQDLLTAADALVNPKAADVGGLLPPVIPQLEEKHDVAVRRGFTRLEPWISDVINALTSLLPQILRLGDSQPATIRPITGIAEVVPPGLSRLFGIVDKLALAPSIQPANSFRLARSVPKLFAAESDIAPRLLATFKPAAAPTLYKGWGAIQTPAVPLKVYAMRTKAAPFGHNAPLMVSYTSSSNGGTTNTPSYSEWLVAEPPPGNPELEALDVPSLPTTHESNDVVSLDASYDKVLAGSWVAIDTSAVDATKTQILAQAPGIAYTRAGAVKTVARADYGMSGKTTRVPLTDPATGAETTWLNTDNANKGTEPDFVAIRQTVVYAQPEELALAEEPLDRDVEGHTVELDGLYDGLESGRWIIVSGQRTDITDVNSEVSSTGVVGSELVMISQVTQGPGKDSCKAIKLNAVPFSGIYSVATSATTGDLLIVGKPYPGLKDFLNTLPTPDAVNQEICDPVQLAPGLYANAYLPSADERQGIFHGFNPIDPDTNQPFPNQTIDPSRWDPNNPPDPNHPDAVYAWRISSLASGSDTLHTTLVLANDLAYTYDASTVTIYGNVVKATHGQTQGEVLGDGDSSQPLQTFALHQSPLTFLPVPTPSGAESTLTVRVNEVEWDEAPNLFVLGPKDREYITRTDDAGTTRVTTGNGVNGLRLPTGTANVKATYRSGTGQVGNVDALQISQMATQPLGVKGVINPLAAKGGADGDTRDQARRNVPIGTLALDRLVSVSDYADFARKFAGIGKASSRRLSDGRKTVVHLTIAGKDDIAIDQTTDLYKALQQALLAAGDPHQPLVIVTRRLKVLVMSAGVKVLPEYEWETVAANLRTTLLDLYSFDNRDLGQSAFLSEAVSAMQAVAGVEYVDMRVFDSVAETVTAAQLAALGTTLGPNSAVEADLAHVDPAATDPSQHIAPAELAILTPDIPDTLILTEITT